MPVPPSGSKPTSAEQQSAPQPANINSAPSRLANRALLSLFDQAWLSALNLALGLALIRLTSKDDYGIYAQLYVAGLFLTSMVDALISNPLTTLASKASPEQRDQLIAHLSRFQSWISTGTALTFGLGAWLVAHHAGFADASWLGLAFACYAKTNAIREFRRSIIFLHHQPGKVLILDLIYGWVLVAGTTVLAIQGWLSIPTIFALLAAANVVALLRQPALPAAQDANAYWKTIASLWQRGRLALTGAALAWGVNYSYLYIGAAWLGVAASAELNASRLLLMPISLCVVAWSRVARPALGVHLVRQEWSDIQRLIRYSVACLLAITALYIAVLWLVLPWLQTYVLGEQYQNAAPLAIAWGVYFAVSCVRWIYSAVLVAQDRYAYLLGVAGTTVVTLLVTIFIAIPHFGTLGAIITLIAVETVSLLLVWTAYHCTARQKTST